MASISWKSGQNGDWSTAADWSTGTVPGAGDTASIFASGSYIITISSADFASQLNFSAASAALYENAGSLTIAGSFAVDSGYLSLNRANTIGSVGLYGGVLAFGNPGALGAGKVTLGGGELLATTSESLGNTLAFSGTSTLAAAHGVTLNVNTTSVTVAENSTLNFGAVGQDGVVIWHTSSSASTSPFAFNVVAGTLEAGDNSVSSLISFGGQATTVDAGATLDAGGFNLYLADLLGSGAVIDSGTAATLTLSAANFSGSIAGPLSLTVDGEVVLSGTNTYTGSTTISSGDILQLGVGGATGSIGGAINDGGTLIIDVSGATTLTNSISGSGILLQDGTGITSINTANTYYGGTILSAGTLAIGNGAALGGGTLTFNGGELLGTATATFANGIHLADAGSTTTFAAATGTTLSLTGGLVFAGTNYVDIGAAGQNGEVLWSAAPSGASAGDTFDVLDGTLSAGNGSLYNTLESIAGTTVGAGATLDWAGNTAGISNLQGAGTVTNSGAAQTMALIGATSFSGTISGALSISFGGNTSLSGLEDYTGDAALVGAITVANSGTYDMVSNANITGSPASMFLNNGLFEKTGGGGVSDVTSDFVNNGTLNVLSGSVQFSGGFTNNGVIHGLVSQSGGVTTISATKPDDFNGDGTSDIFQIDYATGAMREWLMSNGQVSQAPSPGVAAANVVIVGSGDFNGNGTSDLFWENISSGAVGEWLFSNGQITQAPSLGVLSAGQSLVAIGDFNGNGTSDIMWQNSSNNTVGEWLVSNGEIYAAPTLGTTPAGFQVLGSGDFNGDGTSDAFWRTSSGSVGEWLMSNGNINAAPTLGNTAAGFQIVGFGDFTGNGTSDVLWQDTNSSTVGYWLMSNGLISKSVTLGNVSPTLQILGTGQYTGNGTNDILWRDTASGTTGEWVMANGLINQSITLGTVGSNWTINPTTLAVHT